MPTFAIEQRAPGDPMAERLEWNRVATIEALDAASAIHRFCTHHQFVGVSTYHNEAMVNGVGAFRAVITEDDEIRSPFVIQQQDPVGPNDRHRTWSDVAWVEASDAVSAMNLYCADAAWPEVQHHGDYIVVTGVGPFRAIPAHLADELRVTAPPT